MTAGSSGLSPPQAPRFVVARLKHGPPREAVSTVPAVCHARGGCPPLSLRVIVFASTRRCCGGHGVTLSVLFLRSWLFGTQGTVPHWPDLLHSVRALGSHGLSLGAQGPLLLRVGSAHPSRARSFQSASRGERKRCKSQTRRVDLRTPAVIFLCSEQCLGWQGEDGRHLESPRGSPARNACRDRAASNNTKVPQSFYRQLFYWVTRF